MRLYGFKSVRPHYLLKTGLAPYYVCPLKVPGATFVPEPGWAIYAELYPRLPAGDPASLPATEALLDFDKLPAQIFVAGAGQETFFALSARPQR